MDSWSNSWWNANTQVFNFDKKELAQSYEVMGEFIKHVDFREAVYRDQMSGAEAAAKLQEDAEKEWKAAGFG